jgi:hypothetical protein
MVFSMSVTLVTKFFYKYVLERFRIKVICVRPDIADKWMLHHDNTPCHTTLYITECLTSKAFLFPWALYSPNFSLCDFFSLNLKMSSKDDISGL